MCYDRCLMGTPVKRIEDMFSCIQMFLSDEFIIKTLAEMYLSKACLQSFICQMTFEMKNRCSVCVIREKDTFIVFY